MTHFNRYEVDKAHLRARSGPAVGGSVLLTALMKEDLFFPAGHCKGVCIGGYLLQGGFAWNGRKLGMACESVVGYDIVTADGELVHASETENADLLGGVSRWGRFFRVVVQFHLRLYPRPKYIGAMTQVFGMKHLEDAFQWAWGVGPDISPAVEFQLLMTRRTLTFGGPGIEAVAPVFADTKEELEEAVDFLRNSPISQKSLSAHAPAAPRHRVDVPFCHDPLPRAPLLGGRQHVDPRPGRRAGFPGCARSPTACRRPPLTCSGSTGTRPYDSPKWPFPWKIRFTSPCTAPGNRPPTAPATASGRPTGCAAWNISPRVFSWPTRGCTAGPRSSFLDLKICSRWMPFGGQRDGEGVFHAWHSRVGVKVGATYVFHMLADGGGPDQVDVIVAGRNMPIPGRFHCGIIFNQQGSALISTWKLKCQ